jgi:protein-disulfide isomerase
MYSHKIEEDMEEKIEKKTGSKNLLRDLSTPIAIVIAGALIALAVYLSANKPTANSLGNIPLTNDVLLDSILPVTEKDYIKGSIDAPVKIIEYSDTECPFCKAFHPTLSKIYEEYGKAGDVAWVYRHFPLDSIHPKAKKEAEALECVGEIGGNDKFWQYLELLFEESSADNITHEEYLVKESQKIGVDRAKFKECLSSGKYAGKVENQQKNAMEIGGRGTPWTVIVGKNGKKYPLTGAQPYSSVKILVDLALKGK